MNASQKLLIGILNYKDVVLTADVNRKCVVIESTPGAMEIELADSKYAIDLVKKYYEGDDRGLNLAFGLVEGVSYKEINNEDDWEKIEPWKLNQTSDTISSFFGGKT